MLLGADKPGRANLGQGGSGDQMRTDKDGLMDHIIAEDQDQMRSEDQDQMSAEDQDPGGPVNHWRSEDQNQCRAENQDQVSSEDQRRDEQYRLSENKALGNFSPGKFEKTESELEGNTLSIHTLCFEKNSFCLLINVMFFSINDV